MNIASCVKLYQSGNKAKAFIEAGRINIRSMMKEERKSLTIAGEMMNGIGLRFYSQLGMKLEDVEMEAERIFSENFLELKGK